MNVSSKTDMQDLTVMIGDRRVGDAEPVFVVAEAGVNHDGSVDKALRLVDAAAEAGADAVKFQMFRANQIATATAPSATYQKRGTGHRSQATMLAQLELSSNDFTRIKAHCDGRSIPFLATPFAPSEVVRLVELGAAAIKTASTDLNNTPLLEAAARTGLPLIVSTGASTKDELRACVQHLESLGARDRLVLLHCVSVYPTPIESLNMRAVATLRRTFKVPAGLSDHTTSTETGAWAAAAGACVIEKHFTLDRTAKGPDHAMSLDPAQLCTYVRRIREAEVSLGTGRLGMQAIEEDVRRVARKSIVTSTAIPRGARLTDDLITCKRPGTGIAPGEWDRVIGRTVAADIPPDTVLTWDMLA